MEIRFSWKKDKLLAVVKFESEDEMLRFVNILKSLRQPGDVLIEDDSNDNEQFGL